MELSIQELNLHFLKLLGLLKYSDAHTIKVSLNPGDEYPVAEIDYCDLGKHNTLVFFKLSEFGGTEDKRMLFCKNLGLEVEELMDATLILDANAPPQIRSSYAQLCIAA